ncbi:LysR family transcriptional regulator [Thermoflavimicrobium dichotomicum]|uniref:DNA-binding transcriptional regulator, LysR family n=1 Tax=Thermoflavimicrobium dichotomicum TaxID=46223 RepID=A0A1I3U2P9_9BACL|nr:LysR family transcriptional regulator [Thermoflavimicrobium dichotomicum]SFJ77212.1 DNA-binding transcriptional regulator, LysR family [Thermoflavimicrobium dichotomicum]
MNIENIEAFVYVIHYGSFNKAAKALFLSQPSVTARIQSLERELDCKLFDREGKKICLTEKGKQFLPYAQQILHFFQRGKLQLQQKKAVPHELRLGCTVSVSNYLIPELLPKLKEKYPEMNFKLTTASTDEILTKVLNKEIEIGFVRNVTHSSIDSIKFYEDPIRLFVYENHPFIGAKKLSIEMLANQKFVFFECGALDWMQIYRLFKCLGQPPKIEYHVDNLETAKKLVMKGSAICFLPELCVRQEVREKKLFPVDIPELTGVTLQTNIITLKGENTGVYKSFLELAEVWSFRD